MLEEMCFTHYLLGHQWSADVLTVVKVCSPT